MTSEQIHVRIAPDGTITAETKGMKGTRCLDAIQALEELLHAQTTQSSFTDDYHASTTNYEIGIDDELRH